MTETLQGKTIVMSGGSRGIGLAIALRAAADGANVVLIAKTDQPHPKLEGTIHTAAAEIEQAGGQVLPYLGDVRDDDAIAGAVAAAVERFGGIDIVLNNASVLNLSPTEVLTPKQYDLMQDVNARGTFMLMRACLPHLVAADNPQIVSLSPPLNLSGRWLGVNPGYMIAKYSMTLATLGVAHEYADRGVSANCLWPQTTIATAAITNLIGADAIAGTRKPEIMADAFHLIATRPSGQTTGQTLIDEQVLAESGVTDLDRYATSPGHALDTDFFVD